MTYIHELPNWPNFTWSSELLTTLLAEVRHKQGLLIGRMESLGFHLREEATLQTLTLDVLKSSEIEEEILNPEQVRSSVARRLGIDIGALVPTDRNVDGVVEMMLDATQNYKQPLTNERLFSWHAALFPTGYSGMSKINIGNWRDDAKGPMQVVSGAIGREHVHFEAPHAENINGEMASFIKWFNLVDKTDPIFKAAIAHLWFVTIHPFDDGNGRIARALSDMILAKSEKTSQRFYSMSAQIRHERNDYYNLLENTQRSSLDITVWLDWFLKCLERAFDATEVTLSSIMHKADFWNVNADKTINDRQKLIVNKMLDGFEGKLTSSKWAKICKTSQDTASRDISDLIQKGILKKDDAGGRSTSYSLK